MTINWDFFVQPFGIPIALTWTQFFGALTMVNRYPPALFIELGVYRGGLGSLLITRCKYDPKFHYLGIDNNAAVYNPILLGMAKEEPRFEMLFEDIYETGTEVIIKRHIANANGSTMIFCDGGDKLQELLTFSLLLKEGDIIFGHDYPGEYDDDDFEVLLKTFDELDPEFFKDRLLIPAFIRK